MLDPIDDPSQTSRAEARDALNRRSEAYENDRRKLEEAFNETRRKERVACDLRDNARPILESGIVMHLRDTWAVRSQEARKALETCEPKELVRIQAELKVYSVVLRETAVESFDKGVGDAVTVRCEAEEALKKFDDAEAARTPLFPPAKEAAPPPPNKVLHRFKGKKSK